MKSFILLALLPVVMAFTGCSDEGVESSAVKYGIPTGSPYVLGNYDQGPLGGGGWSGNFMQAFEVSVPNTTYLVGMGLKVSNIVSPPTQGKMGLYQDNGGTPGSLVAGSGAQTLVVGRNEFAIQPKRINPGTYWMVFRFSDSVDLNYQSGSKTRVYRSFTFATAWPNPFPPPGGSSPSNENILYIIAAD